jgi:hypothetical protein
MVGDRPLFHFNVGDAVLNPDGRSDPQGSYLGVIANKALYNVGLVIYVFSFFFVATADLRGVTGRMTGYECAYLAIQSSLTDNPFSPNSAAASTSAPVFVYLSILISGLINPVFLIYMTLTSLKRAPRAVRALKFALLAMIPFCWVVFYFVEIYPREGHVLWVIGMLLVLLSSWKQVSGQVV